MLFSPAAFPLQNLLSFAAYFATAVALLFAFQWIYTRVTPHDEVALIKDNKAAAAVTYGGALIGFVLPLASVIAHSVNLLDMVVWSVIAGVVQLLAFFVVRLFYPGLSASIAANELAPALKLAFVSVAVGILNAACMTY